MNSKATEQRHQRMLSEFQREAGNESCADCGARMPRWASWNLGILICMQCAGVHRKMGTHISKVKSLTLDSWTREQVDTLRQMGNRRSNAKYIADPLRTRPPTNVDEMERNSELERYIFDKYRGKFMERKPPPVPKKDASSRRPFPPGSPKPGSRRSDASSTAPPSPGAGSDIVRSRTAPVPDSSASAGSSSPATGAPVCNGSLAPPSVNPLTNGLGVTGESLPQRSASAAGGASSSSKPTPGVFDELISLQSGAASTPQPPIQMNGWATLQAQQQSLAASPLAMPGYDQSSAAGLGQSAFGMGANGMMAATATGMGTGMGMGIGQMGMNGATHSMTTSASTGNLPSFAFSAAPGVAGLSAQQQHDHHQQQVLMQQQGRSASLGSLAFTPGGTHLAHQTTSVGPSFNPFFASAASSPVSPQMLGQGAFGSFHQQQQQQQQQQQHSPYLAQQQHFGMLSANNASSPTPSGYFEALASAAGGAAGSSAFPNGGGGGGAFSQQYQQQQQPPPPQPSQLQPSPMGQDNFGSWANSFMPAAHSAATRTSSNPWA